MAAAIMSTKLREAGYKDFNVMSCGTLETEGQKATTEANIAIKKLGYEPLKNHRSRQLNQELVDWADVVYCMTMNHVPAVRTFEGGNNKANLLAKRGVEDPMGQTQEIFDKIAKEIEKAIHQQLYG